MKNNFNTRKFRGGAYAMAVSTIVIAILIVINLVFTKLDITKDLTSNGKYSLTEETVEMIGELEDEIVFYYLAPSGESIDLFDKILSQYTKNSENITLVRKDPVMNPRFASQYTQEEVEEFSIIVVNQTNGRSRYVSYSSMLIEEYGIDYSTYQYYSEVTGLDMEGQLNSAIGYVTMEHLPTMYEVSGHGMQTIGSNTISMLEKANIQVFAGDDALDLLTLQEIPEDCDVLLLQTPETDFTEEEIVLLSEYMEEGGKVILVLSYMDAEHENLLGFLETYGILMEDGILMEENSRYYMQAPYILVPSVVSNDITKEIYQSKYVIAQTASALTVSEELADELTVKGFLKTSGTAYIKGLDFSTYYKEDGDMSGTFYVGVLAENSETGGQMAVYSGMYIFNDAYATSSTFGNIDILVNSVNVLADIEATVPTVRTLDLTADTYITMTEAQANSIALVVVILLPLCLLCTGIVYVVYRRKHT